MKRFGADFAIIGAGFAGLSAARLLTVAGASVVLFDKSRGLGGRAATRRIGEQPVDHGAQFFTVRDSLFHERVAEWLDAGLCREWCKGFPVWEDGAIRQDADGHPRYCCPGGMTSLAKHEAKGLDVRRDCAVHRVGRATGGYLIETAAGQFEAGGIISTAPAPQTLAILGELPDPRSRESLAAIDYSPCLACIVEAPGFSPDWPALRVRHSALEWIASEESRKAPGGTGLFVLHASGDYSRAHLEEDPAEACVPLLAAARGVCGPGFDHARILHAHRWRFARVASPDASRPFLPLPPASNLAFAGDAFGRGNIESAWISGRAAAASLAPRAPDLP